MKFKRKCYDRHCDCYYEGDFCRCEEHRGCWLLSKMWKCCSCGAKNPDPYNQASQDAARDKVNEFYREKRRLETA